MTVRARYLSRGNDGDTSTWFRGCYTCHGYTARARFYKADTEFVDLEWWVYVCDACASAVRECDTLRTAYEKRVDTDIGNARRSLSAIEKPD